MKLSDAICRKVVAGLRATPKASIEIENQLACVTYAEIADALEERLEPTREEVIAHLERVSNEMREVSEYREYRMYFEAANMLRAYHEYLREGCR